jgi:GTP-binding protein
LIDDELEEGLSKDLPDIPYVFISAVAGKGIDRLKDMLWEEINKPPVLTDNLVHRDRDVYDIDFEDDEEEDTSTGDEEGDIEVDW